MCISKAGKKIVPDGRRKASNEKVQRTKIKEDQMICSFRLGLMNANSTVVLFSSLHVFISQHLIIAYFFP